MKTYIWKIRRFVVRHLVKLSLLESNVIWSLDLSVEDSPSSYSGPKYSVAVWSIGWSKFTLKRLQLAVGSRDLSKAETKITGQVENI